MTLEGAMNMIYFTITCTCILYNILACTISIQNLIPIH